MGKIFEINGEQANLPMNLNLLKDDGNMEDYFLINDGVKEKIALGDLVDSQIVILKKDSENFESGDNSRQASSGNYSNQASSGYGSRQASNGNYSNQASSGYGSRQASSGDNSRQASNGNYSNQASSGDNSRQASSGDGSRQASSGDGSRQASSGDNSRQASNGDNSRQASNGNYSNQASSGDNSRQASSGDGSRQASSGDGSRQASSGDNSNQASSGDNSRHELTGNNSVCFACGNNSIIKSKNGTWISLCEYENNSNIPVFALSAQIGNENYKDFKEKILNENDFYILKNKQFMPVIINDGIKLIKLSSKTVNDIEVIKCAELDNIEKTLFCVSKNGISAHGRTLKQAMSDLAYKELESKNKQEHIDRIKNNEYVTREDYRLITGACQFGTEQFCKEKGIEKLEKIELKKLLKILDDNYYGAKEFKKYFE